MELLPSAYAINPPDIGWNYSAKYTKDTATLSGELFQGYPSGLLTFASATCIVFILVGVPGNLITIIALARCKKVRNATAVFIINLSLSDLLFCCFNLPLAASTFWYRAWIHGELLCRFFPLLRYGLLAVSLFTILAITINRYVMIGHPRIYPRVYRHKYLGVMVAATWLGAFCALIPTWRGAWGQFGLDQTIGSCSILRDENKSSPKQFLFIMAFVVPCISIVVCYARIFYIVRKTAMRTHEPNALTNSSVHINQPAKALSNNKNGKNRGDEADRQLLKTNSEQIETQENPSENSNSNANNNDRNHRQHNDIDGISEHSSTASYTQALCGPKILLKFIDSSVDSDLPPSLSGLKTTKDPKLLSESDRNLSSISISKSVEFKDENDGAKKNNFSNRSIEDRMRKPSLIKNCTLNGVHDVDSAVEESTSSTETNQIYHIRSPNNCNQHLSVQIEPSSSSGIDIPLDNDSPPRQERIRKSLTTSIRRVKKTKDKNGAPRKQSTMNTSGASILYPGRMTNKDRRLLKMILVIFVSFLICYLPITTTKIIKSVHEIPFLNIMGYLLIYLTTCINPIIYVVMSSEYRQAYWNLLMCRSSSNTSRVKNSSKEAPRKNSQKT